MTPPRVLPPGHFVGDGHNHGAEAGDHVHNHGHDHAHESPEQHLHHMQERQQVRARATLEEFQQAARETAQLTTGQRPPELPQGARGEPRTSSREQVSRNGPAENRQAQSGPDARHANGESARATTREFAGLARFFAPTFAAPANHSSAWAEASRQAGFRQPRSLPDMANPSPKAGPESSSAPEPGPAHPSHGSSDAEPSALPQALAKLQIALHEIGIRNSGLAKIPPEAAEALAVLLHEAANSPELTAGLPPALKSLIQSLAGPAGALSSQLLAKISVADLGHAIRLLLSRGAPLGVAVSFGGFEWPTRGLGLLLGAPLFAPNSGARLLSMGLLQRFEKALLQLLRLFERPSPAKPAKDAPLLDKALLEQLAAMVGAEEKRRQERARAKRKEETSPSARSKGGSDFDENEESEGSRSLEELRTDTPI